MRLLSRLVARGIPSRAARRWEIGELAQLASSGHLRTGPEGPEAWQVVLDEGGRATTLRRGVRAFLSFQGASRVELREDEDGSLQIQVWIPRFGAHALLGALPLGLALWLAPLEPAWLGPLVAALLPGLATLVEWTTGRERRRAEQVLNRLEALLEQLGSPTLAARSPSWHRPETSEEALDGLLSTGREATDALRGLAERAQAGPFALLEPAGAVMRADPRPVSLGARVNEPGSLTLACDEPDESLGWSRVDFVALEVDLIGYRFSGEAAASKLQRVAGTAVGFAAMFLLGVWLLAVLTKQEMYAELPALLRSLICFSWPPAYLAWTRTACRAEADASALLEQAMAGRAEEAGEASPA